MPNIRFGSSSQTFTPTRQQLRVDCPLIISMSDSGNGFDLGSNSASRHEKSLGLLTTKFVSLLQDAKDGVLDLKQVWKAFFRC